MIHVKTAAKNAMQVTVFCFINNFTVFICLSSFSYSTASVISVFVVPTKNPWSPKLQGFHNISYFTNKDVPDISFGCSIPINSINVGAISAKHPPSLSVYAGSAFTKINGTGFVVCAVNGAPVS